MAVYVDNYAERGGRLGRMRMSHLYADTSAELEAMAERLGLTHNWVQYPGTYKEHYDVSLTKRREAVAAGAQQTDWRHLARFMEARRHANTGATP